MLASTLTLSLLLSLIHTLRKSPHFRPQSSCKDTGARGTCNYTGAVICGKVVGAGTDLVCVNYKERRERVNTDGYHGAAAQDKKVERVRES